VEKGRSLSASYSTSASAFRGAISSATSDCKQNQPVTIFKARSGADLKIATVRSSSNRSYNLPKSSPAPGTYYATLARTTTPGVGVCLAGQSSSVKLLARSVCASYAPRAKAFRGAVSSATPACKRSQPVTVLRARSGPDLKVGTAGTTSTGAYSLAQSRKPPTGTYYATVASRASAGVGVCLAAQSPNFRLLE
jgi:hypothetical protein